MYLLFVRLQLWRLVLDDFVPRKFILKKTSKGRRCRHLKGHMYCNAQLRSYPINIPINLQKIAHLAFCLQSLSENRLERGQKRWSQGRDRAPVSELVGVPVQKK